jgi:hypothetical protein
MLVTTTVRNLILRAGARGALANVEADRARAASQWRAVDAVLARVPAPAAPSGRRAA